MTTYGHPSRYDIAPGLPKQHPVFIRFFCMKITKVLTTASVVVASLLTAAQKYPLNKNRNPTATEVIEYIKAKDTLINNRFDEKFDVRTHYLPFVPGAADKYIDYYEGERGLYLGRRGEEKAIIDTVESYGYYSLKDIPEKKKDSTVLLYGSLRGTMIHEKAHAFFFQIKSRLEKKEIRHFYHDFNRFYFSQSFIAEGVAQYCTYKMGEVIIPEKYHPSDTLENLIDEKASELKYQYALYYLKDFLDFFGLKEGTKILLTNPPPRKDELIHPLKYYRRLEHYGSLDLGFFHRMFTREDFFEKF